MNRLRLKEKVIKLRKQGKIYKEILKILKINIPKSTLSYWCHNLPLPFGYQRKIQEYNKFNLNKARQLALIVNREKRKNYLQSIIIHNQHLVTVDRKSVV